MTKVKSGSDRSENSESEVKTRDTVNVLLEMATYTPNVKIGANIRVNQAVMRVLDVSSIS